MATTGLTASYQRLYGQYIEIRSALLALKARHKVRKGNNQQLTLQVAAFQKLVRRQCILLKEREEEIKRLERIVEEYQAFEMEDMFGWNSASIEEAEVEVEVVEDSGIGSSQSRIESSQAEIE